MSEGTILIVDDDEDIQRLLSFSLKKSNYKIVSAEDGQAGLDLLEKERPALVIVDLNMPVLGGIGFLEKIQPMADNPFSVFVLTGDDDGPNIRQCFELGVSSFLKKPVNMIELHGLVEHFILLQRRTLFHQNTSSSFRDIADSSSEAILILDLNGKLLYANSISEYILGVRTSEMIGQELGIPTDKVGWRELEINHPDRKTGVGEMRVIDIQWYGQDARMAMIRDITSQKEDEERIQHLAFHDPVTDLPNRALLIERINYEIMRSSRNNDMFSVMFVDLDRFKVINDSLGHRVGDWLLRETAVRIKSCLRRSDTVARQSSDEFIVLLPDLNDILFPAVLARKILEELEKPYHYQAHEIYISGSIGINIFPQIFSRVKVEGEADLLLQNAAAAMYTVKHGGGNHFKYFNGGEAGPSEERVKLESRLHRALDKKEFQLYYQPKVDLKTNQVVGLEALIRWKHPDLGMISPLDFIPIAEENGLIVPIGDWVLKTALRQNRLFQKEGLNPLMMGVNISPRQFLLVNLGEHIQNLLKNTGMDFSHLEIEITESMLMSEPNKAQVVLESLHSMGIHISIDDFGTGYSSLSRLKSFPVDILKIDRSFITGLPNDRDSIVLTSTIIGLAHNLNLLVIAEGVETREQLECLRSMNCDQVQGFYFSPPLSADDILIYLKEMQNRPTSVD